ncbi:hypothetical protein ACJRO7_018932 [Eucalyptus globulus]|uniref:Acidic protein n=1 Tax=Eucalyptus globulus TaxID=34317 RepID=A0ABD3L6B5_EUCGL
MEDLGIKRLMSMVAMLVLILGVSAVGVRGLDACHEDCISDCRDSRVPSCYAQCVRERCNPPLATSLGHCELGCKVTKCNGLKSDAKELEVCANACSEGCKATYIAH